MADQLNTKSYGVYAYYWRGQSVPYYIGKDSHINENVRDSQHRTVTPAKTIIDKALQGKFKTGLKYRVVSKFGTAEDMDLAEALLIDYWHRRDGCKANIVNELYSTYNRNKFWPGYSAPVVVSVPTKEASWIKKR